MGTKSENASASNTFVPLFGEHNMNKNPEETGCEKAGFDGLVCCCKRTCPIPAAASDAPADNDASVEEATSTESDEATPTEDRFFVCGIVEVKRSWSNQGDVGHYHGINSSGGKHHLGEMSSGLWKSKRLCGVHNRRRLKKH